MDLYVGTSGYSYKAWKGKFYPSDLPNREMLSYYSSRLRAVEINSTFNAMPKASVLEGWANCASPGFLFGLKAPRQITHFRKLKNVDGLVSSLFEAAKALSEHQGPVLFQLPGTFKKDVPQLREFLTLLPSQCYAAFEFRHPSWFVGEVSELLHNHRAALCFADGEEDLEVPFEATTDWGYLRLRRPDYSTAKLKVWAKRVRDQHWRTAFVFFRHEDEGKGPRMAQRLMELAA